MLDRSHWRHAIPLLITLLAVSIGGSAVASEGIDTRRWSIMYWQSLAEKGLIPVNPDVPVPPAVYTESAATDGPDVAVKTGNFTQSETSIFVNPLDNSKVLNSNNSTNWPVTTLYGTSHFESADAGATWGGSHTAPGGSNSGDPAAAINLDGRYLIGYISTSFGQGVAWSDNEGVTWSRNNSIGGTGSLDKNHLWVDNSPTSPHEGNIYSAWTNFSSPYGEVQIARSTNGGSTWQTRQTISTAVPAGSHHQGVHIQTGPDGEVYATWAVYQQWSPGQYAEDGIGLAISNDGGATWNAGTQILGNIKGIRGEGSNVGGSYPIRLASFPVMAVDISGGARDGWMYIVWTNIGVPGVNTGTNWDVYLIRSTDEGATWSTPSKVNGNTNTNRRNFYPWITCDPETGNLSVIYHDNRNTAGNTVEVWVNNSTDGGVTWTDEFKVSDVSFTPAPIAGLAFGYMGDYVGINARGGKVYPVWADNRAGNVLTYVSAYDFEGGTGGGIPCGDFFFFNGRCNSSGAAQAMVKITGDYGGETVTFELDGNPHDVTLLSDGVNSIGKLQVANAGIGAHVIELVDPAGCYSPVNITCTVDAVPDPDWEAIASEYDAMLEAQASESIPANRMVETRILGNYPNPFNPSTTIRYQLGVDGPVSVKIFNMLGQEVATLVDGFQGAGEHAVTWNGVNNAGQSVSSGLYVYRIQSGSTVLTEKMLFAK